MRRAVASVFSCAAISVDASQTPAVPGTWAGHCRTASWSVKKLKVLRSRTASTPTTLNNAIGMDSGKLEKILQAPREMFPLAPG